MNKITIKAQRLAGWPKFVGLIGKQKPEPVYFETRWGIHTFGMKVPIDVVILDKDNKVITVKHRLSPNRIFLWNPKYYKVVEIPSGFMRVSKSAKLELVYK